MENYDGYDFDISIGLLCDSIEVYEIIVIWDDMVFYLFFELEGEFV